MGSKMYTQNYGDAMDLDAMDNGQSSRPKGRYPGQKAQGNKERERRRNQGLCYNCGKARHQIKNCDQKTVRLQMMIASTVGKKADTTVKTCEDPIDLGIAQEGPNGGAQGENLPLAIPFTGILEIKDIYQNGTFEERLAEYKKNGEPMDATLKDMLKEAD